MIEVSKVRQVPGEPRRRWFSSTRFDLFLQCADDGRFVGFQLYYDKPHREHAIVYSDTDGFRHLAVDDGEHRPGRHKASPMLTKDGVFEASRIYASFNAASADIPVDVAGYVGQALARYPNFQGAA